MTFKEWMMKINQKNIYDDYVGVVNDCPYYYGLEAKEESNKNCKHNDGKGCEYCWNREMPEKEKSMKKEFTKADLKPGDHFDFKGFEWIVLDNNVDDGVLAIMTSTWNGKEYCFDKNDSNNYAKSSLRRKLLNELLPVLGEDNLIPHEVDLVADNGDDRYGKIADKVFILSCDEYRKYRKNVPLFFECMWTCTPWYIPYSGDGSYVRFVNTAGGLGYGHASGSSGVAPACVFKNCRRG